MSETAVGLFADATVADAVVDSLKAHGFPSSSIRILAASNGTASVSVKADGKLNGMDDGDFAAKAARDLRAIGANEYESNAYVARLRRGNVLVHAAGTRRQADEAVGIMNEFSAMELEEFTTAGSTVSSPKVSQTDLGTINPESRLPESQVTIGEHETTYTSHSSRSKTEGARVFTW